MDVQINLLGPVNESLVSALIQVVSERTAQGARSFTVGISSPGGTVFHGVTAHNFLVGAGLDITTHNYGQVDSIAGVIFCAGERRLAVPHSRFLIHSISANFAAGSSLQEKQFKERLAGLEKDRDTIATILSERSGTDLAQVKSDMVNGRILVPEEAMAYGLIHEIRQHVFDPGIEIVNIHTQ